MHFLTLQTKIPINLHHRDEKNNQIGEFLKFVAYFEVSLIFARGCNYGIISLFFSVVVPT